jgi:hypothetical protein
MKTIELFPTKYISQTYHSPVIAIVGGNTNCKDRIVKEIMQTHKFPKAIVYTPDYNLAGLIDSQLILKRENFKRDERGEEKNDIRVLLIIDDHFRNADIGKLIISNRHYDITVILTMKYEVGITLPPRISTNISYIFLMGEKFNTDEKLMLTKIYNYYGDSVHITSYHSFYQEFGDVTTNGGALVLNNRYDGGCNHDEKIGGYWKETV